MEFPIVNLITSDGLNLFGYLAEATSSKTILINIHGTASGFYVEEFEKYFIEELPQLGISTLFTNNRGNFVQESWQKTGAAVEKFEDCLIDINNWIEFALSQGYEKIILQGHSLGTEKVVYYMNRGKYADKVVAVSLLGFADSYGNQMLFAKDKHLQLMNEANDLVKQYKGDQYLTSVWFCHAGVLPKSAASYINFFSQDSELSKALPLRLGKDLKYYSEIKVPILGIVGDKDPWTILPVPEAAELMRKGNQNADVFIISDCEHSFTGKQKELIEIVKNFLKGRINLH